MSNPTNWSYFYTHQPQPSSTFTTTDATAVTTTAPPPPSVTTTTTHLNPEGRVSKPARRRSRASRRTPTTLLSTDTTNFRAMVQQFTGGPSTAALGSGFSVNSNPGLVYQNPAWQYYEYQRQIQNNNMFHLNNDYNNIIARNINSNPNHNNEVSDEFGPAHQVQGGPPSNTSWLQ